MLCCVSERKKHRDCTTSTIRSRIYCEKGRRKDSDPYKFLDRVEPSNQMENDHFIASSMKCGEIFFYEKKFTFNCTHCDTNFDHYPTLIKHFLTCFQTFIETNSFNNREEDQDQSQPSTEQHSAKEQSQEPFERNRINNKKPPTELLNLFVTRRRRRDIKKGRKILFNCRACGKKYFTKVAFKAHKDKLTNNCISVKDALHLAVAAIKKDVSEEEDGGAEGLSQLNPPIGK